MSSPGDGHSLAREARPSSMAPPAATNSADPDLDSPERAARVAEIEAKIAALGLSGEEAMRNSCFAWRAPRAVIGPDGTRYPSQNAAARATGRDQSVLGSWCRKNFNGWKFEGEA